MRVASRRRTLHRQRGAAVLLVSRSALLTLMLTCAVFATTYRLLTPSEIFTKADVVFTARVVDVTAEIGSSGALEEVFTTVTFGIEEVLAGVPINDEGDPDAPPGESEEEPNGLSDQGTFTLDFLGGEGAGDRRLLVAGSPVWRTGDSVLVAAYVDADLASPLVGFRQGLWQLSDGAFVDQDGIALGLDTTGRPVRSDLPGVASEILEAVRALLAGELPDSEVPDSEPLGNELPDGEQAPGPDAPEEPSPDAPADDDAADTPAAVPSDTNAEPNVAGDEDVANEDVAEEDNASDAAAGEEPTVVEEPLEPISVSYRVEDSGGPLLLSEATATAAADWRAVAAETINIVVEDVSDNVFAYGAAALFSPETLSLTLVSSDGVRVLLSPQAGALLPRALHHELGLLLGLAAGGPGVMVMAVTPEGVPPGAAELAELTAVGRFPAADLSRDGVVDFLDLLEFSRNFGRSGLNLPGDLDRDGDVDEDDLALLEESYELTPPRRDGAED